MEQISALLELRSKIKDKKPEFVRQDYQRRKRLGKKLKWRKPKGIHSKIRHKFKGRRKMPSPGYKSPTKVKFLHSSGLKILRVSSLNELNNIDANKEGIIISRSVGMKKKAEILRKARELRLAVLNLNIDDQLKKIEAIINSKKNKGEIKKKEEVTTDQKSQLDKLSNEEKKETEKKEKDKVLTKRI